MSDEDALRQKIHDLRGELQTLSSRIGLQTDQLTAHDKALEKLEADLQETARWRAGFIERVEASTASMQMQQRMTNNLINAQNRERKDNHVVMSSKMEAVTTELVGLKTRVAIYTGLAVFLATFGKELVMILVQR